MTDCPSTGGVAFRETLLLEEVSGEERIGGASALPRSLDVVLLVHRDHFSIVEEIVHHKEVQGNSVDSQLVCPEDLLGGERKEKKSEEEQTRENLAIASPC